MQEHSSEVPSVEVQIRDSPVGMRACPITLDRTERLNQTAFQAGAFCCFSRDAIECNHASAARNQVDQPFEGRSTASRSL